MALLPHGTGRGKERSAGAIAPEQPWTDDTARIARKVRPPVFVDVVALLPVSPSKERRAPPLRERLGRKQHRIGSAAARAVDHRVARRVLRRPLRDQIVYAAEGARSI